MSFGLAEDQEGIGHGVLALARAIHDLAGHPHLRRLAAIKVHGFGTAKPGHEIGQFGQFHAHRKPRLPTVDDDKIHSRWAPTDSRARIPLILRALAPTPRTARRRGSRGKALAILDQSGPAPAGRLFAP